MHLGYEMHCVHQVTEDVVTFLLKNIGTLWVDMSKNCQMSANSIDTDQMLQTAASDLGFHCLHRPVCPNT